MAAPRTMLYPTFPSSTESFTPVTVTVWAVFQLAAVKTSEAVLTDPSVVSLELTGMVTFAVGAEPSLTVKEIDPPASVVVAEGLGAETSIELRVRTAS